MPLVIFMGMSQLKSAIPVSCYVLRVSPSLGQRVRAHLQAVVKAAGGIETFSHFVMKALTDALAKSEEGQS